MKIKILCATAIALVIRQAVAAESELQFNPAFLNGERANSADLAWVNAGSALPPGEYNLNVYINTQFAFTGNVTFRVAENTVGEALPCLTPAQFAALGIDSRQAKGGELPPAQRCIFLTRSFADTRFDFDQRTLTLNFTVPQSAMRALPRGYVSPESWESGIPAAWLNYVVNGANNDYRGETRTR